MDRKEQIQEWLDKGYTLKLIGNRLGVTRQRVYQLLTLYGLEAPERKRHGFWKTQSPQEQWLWKCLANKITDTQERFELFKTIKIPTHCPILGLELDWSEKQLGGRTDNSPSLDKVIPERGYINGNVVIMSWRANRIKNDGTWEEHQKIADFTKKHLEG